MKMRRFAMNYKKRKRMFEKYVEPFADDVFRIINNVFDDNELSNDLAQIVMEKANLINDQTTTMRYAVTGEMISLVESKDSLTVVSQENVYNHNGQRIIREQDGITRNYYYDRGVAVFTLDGTTLSGANVLDIEGDAIGTYRDSIYYNYLKDGQASTTNLVKQDGAVAAAYDYSDFGETTELTGSGFDNQICYTGGIYDEETGLYYLNGRYYDPEIGRFISQDSYRGELNDPGQWHLYAYCANNPINYVDPSGHTSKWISDKKTMRYYSSNNDSGHNVWRVRANMSVNYTKANDGVIKIYSINMSALGDKHTGCENGYCRIVYVKIAPKHRKTKNIKGYSDLVKRGNPIYLSPNSVLYFNSRILKKYSFRTSSVKISAYYYFTPPNGSNLSWGKGVTLSVKI